MLWGAAELVAKRAGAIESQAAKNASAGFDKGRATSSSEPAICGGSPLS
jgi:hypothetical protein